VKVKSGSCTITSPKLQGAMSLDEMPEAGALISIDFPKPLDGTGGYARYVAIALASWKEGDAVSGSSGAPIPTQIYPRKPDSLGVLRSTPVSV